MAASAHRLVHQLYGIIRNNKRSSLLIENNDDKITVRFTTDLENIQTKNGCKTVNHPESGLRRRETSDGEKIPESGVSREDPSIPGEGVSRKKPRNRNSPSYIFRNECFRLRRISINTPDDGLEENSEII